jgi:hypothetical protein
MFKFDLGLTNLVQHKIDTKDEKPVKIPPRRVPLAQRKEVETEIQKMLDNDIIQPSHFPWSTAMVVVKKPTGIRICLDYRKLNEVTVKDSYPLPRIDDSLDALRGNVWFSTVDLCLDPRLFFAGVPSHYLQHPLAKSLNEKIAMSRQSTKSRYQRKLVPLGIRSIMKEERCYLPDGSMIEMRDTWTMDNKDTTEE